MRTRRTFTIALAIIFGALTHAQIGFAATCSGVVSGQYRVFGQNTDGSTYNGYAGINQNGKSVAVAWKIGTREYNGSGRLRNCVLTVDWGADTPVIYKVLANGELDGTWDSGRATEKLVPR